LEEAEFFASQGLYSDAEAILTDMLRSAPDHVLLREQLSEIHATLQEQLADEAPPDSLDPNDNSFDIAASLDALDDLAEPTTAPEMAAPGEEVDVDLVFAKFKEGVKAVVKDSDAATHYDLGLAYREMGLLDDACGEFELASNDPGRACMCAAMIGMTRRDQGKLAEAKEALLKGLGAKQRTPDQEKSLEYDLALVCQDDGDNAGYLHYLKLLAAKDKNYRDVGARLRALGEKLPEGGEDEDAEFDAAFDNLF
jgi:tetratricopeptide (TPR) repeat protein